MSDDSCSIANDMVDATAETNVPSEPALDSDVDLSWALEEYPSERAERQSQGRDED